MDMEGKRRSDNVEDRRLPEPTSDHEELVQRALMKMFADAAHKREAVSQGLSPAGGDYSQLDLATILGSERGQEMGVTPRTIGLQMMDEAALPPPPMPSAYAAWLVMRYGPELARRVSDL